MTYTILIFVLAIIQQSRGNQRVWTGTVHQLNFLPTREDPGMVPQQQVYSPQQLLPVQYAAGAPPATYSTSPPQHVTPMNTGYAQPPANTGYAQGPGYAQDPASAGYAPAPAHPQFKPKVLE